MNPTFLRNLQVIFDRGADGKPTRTAMRNCSYVRFGQCGLLAALLFLTGVAQTGCGREGAFADAASLLVTVDPAQIIVKNNQHFTVRTTLRIRNIMIGERLIAIWSCSYPEQWTADNPAVHIEQASCTKNGIETIKLKPGETLDRKLSIWVSMPTPGIVAKSVTFRLGFTQGPSGRQNERKPVWSDTVTVKVTK